jgi:hypothetical protein
MLRVVAEAQRRRWPNRIPTYPPEIRGCRLDQVAHGFQFLLLGDSKCSALVPELDGYPTLTYPARRLPGGRATQVVVVDGWSGEPTGLMANIPHLQVALEGTLQELDLAAWKALISLDLALDSASRVTELRGELDQEGWAAVPGLRDAAQGFRLPEMPPRFRGPDGEDGGPVGGGRP